MDKVAIVGTGPQLGLVPKYVVAVDNVTPETHKEVAAQLNCSEDDIQIVSKKQYLEMMGYNPTMIIESAPRIHDTMSYEQLAREMKEAETPWYNKFNKRKKWKRK